MRSHLFLAGAFTTAAAVALPPVYPPPSYNNTSPLSNAEFGLTMRIPGTNRTFAALVATKNGTQEELVLVARRLSVYTGTPAYVTNEQPKDSRGFDGVALNMDVNGTSYALSAADIGDSRGAHFTVRAVKGGTDEEWAVSSDGEVNHMVAASNNMLLACKETVNGEETYVLSWGSPEFNGSDPVGCGWTSIQVNCNVPGSQYPLCSSG